MTNDHGYSQQKDNYATTADGLTEKFTTSIETGRDLEGIAKGLKSRRKTDTKRTSTKPKRPDKLRP